MGDKENNVDFTFKGFTFNAREDAMCLQCQIVLCAIDDNGKLIQPDCGFKYGGDDCIGYKTGSTYGYTLAKTLSIA